MQNMSQGLDQERLGGELGRGAGSALLCLWTCSSCSHLLTSAIWYQCAWEPSLYSLTSGSVEIQMISWITCYLGMNMQSSEIVAILSLGSRCSVSWGHVQSQSQGCSFSALNCYHPFLIQMLASGQGYHTHYTVSKTKPNKKNPTKKTNHRQIAAPASRNTVQK